MQQTPRRRRQNQQATHATDNVKQTADDMQENASTSRCNRKHTAPPHIVCSEQRAADNWQHVRSIVLDNQCATRRRRHTQDATYDRCRSMQQTHAEPTTRSGKCNARDERGDKRKPDARAPRGCAGLWNHGPKGLKSPKVAQVFRMALGDASDVAAQRLHISLACAHRWPTHDDRLRRGMRTRLGAREAHAVWFLLHPATATASFTRSDKASGSFYDVSPQRTRASSFAPLFPMRCHACSVLPVSCLLQNNASRMLLVRCPLLAAHEMRPCRAFSVAPRMCSRPLACRLLSVARYRLHALPGLAVFCLVSVAVLPCCLVALLPCSLLPVVNGVFPIPRCMLHAARCPLPVACCMLRCMWLLSAACCLKSGACCLLRVACRLLFAAYCPLHGACCPDVVCR
jgi:hypothetical protein